MRAKEGEGCGWMGEDGGEGRTFLYPRLLAAENYKRFLIFSLHISSFTFLYLLR